MKLRLNRRPLCLYLSLFLISLFVFSFFYSSIKPIVAAVVLCAFGISLLCRCYLFRNSNIAHKAFILFLFLTSVALSLIISYASFDLKYNKQIRDVSGKSECTVVITGVNEKTETNSSYQAVIISCNGTECKIPAVFTTDFISDYKSRDVITAELDIIHSSHSNYITDKNYLAKGILCFASCSNRNTVKLSGKMSAFPYTQIDSLRSYCSNALSKHLDGQALAQSQAIIYGDKSLLSDTTLSAFANLGVSHTLAISGLHMGIIITFLTFFLSIFSIPRKVRHTIILLSGLVYIFIAGLSPSVCRTYIMFAFMILSEFSRRKRDNATTLVMALSLICVISPFSILDIGLHLSFFSTLGILIYALPIIEKINDTVSIKPVRHILSMCAITVCATMFTLPYNTFVFGQISIISPIANIIYIPIITLMVYLSVMVIIFTFIPLIPDILSYAFRTLSDLLSYLTEGIFQASHAFLLPLDSDFGKISSVIFCITAVIMMYMGVNKRKVLGTFGLFVTTNILVSGISYLIC